MPSGGFEPPLAQSNSRETYTFGAASKATTAHSKLFKNSIVASESKNEQKKIVPKAHGYREDLIRTSFSPLHNLQDLIFGGRLQGHNSLFHPALNCLNSIVASESKDEQKKTVPKAHCHREDSNLRLPSQIHQLLVLLLGKPPRPRQLIWPKVALVNLAWVSESGKKVLTANTCGPEDSNLCVPT
jgi:hypothetical protein